MYSWINPCQRGMRRNATNVFLKSYRPGLRAFLSEDLARPNSVRYGTVDQKFSNFIGWQAYVVCFVPQNTDTVVLYIDVASRQIASTATVATAKDYSVATPKIKRINWVVAIKATLSPTVALFLVVRISIEQVS